MKTILLKKPTFSENFASLSAVVIIATIMLGALSIASVTAAFLAVATIILVVC